MALDLAHGSASTRELWPTYLQIHIKDVIGEPAKREAAHALLLRLEDQIARGSH
jgi:hypothetical protein